ncbi:MAG: glycosyltransferase 87 family protein [Micropruina sp.]|uniref:glycosyltransferase family 87 protein n=1 Tax=Micropruina sp. TaxID=2737536 RepID=UPI0039E40A68
MTAARVLGGTVGHRAERSGVWFNPQPWVLLLGTVSYLVLMLRQVPCQLGASVYQAMCYSDILPLFYARRLSDGKVPFISADVEYPVLIGAFMEGARRITTMLGGQVGTDVPDSAIAQAAALFVGVNAVLLFLFFLLLLWAQLRLARPWDAMMIAISPAVITTGLINWDFMVLAFTALGVLAWARRRPGWAGIWWGLGIAAKLYPLLLFVPLAVLCFRSARLRAFWLAVAGAAGSWVAVNLPVYLLSPSGWLYFWTFNVDRGADLGSIWYAFSLAGHPVPDASAAQTWWMVVGTAAICLLLLLAPRRPRLAQGFLLLIVLFLVVNKVYSPQYVLWLLPFVVLARPRWRDWLIWSAGEAVYFVAIWAHLDGALDSGSGGQGLYLASVLVRVGVQLWIAALVVRDILWPQFDPVRNPQWTSRHALPATPVDDPDGGVLDQAPVAPWLRVVPWLR